ncbi:MAG: M1 family metallopeptidase [Gemmatimonadota bacterium]|nr:M1 family metallopeptidase [Gemmatimonadota bacterium]
MTKPLSVRTAIPAALLVCAVFVGVLAHPLSAQQEQGVIDVRPIPQAVTPPRPYRASVERGWRAPDGSPTDSYWQQWTSYDLEGRLDPETGRLDGSVRIRYANNAPATLGTVQLHLHQNLHKEGVPRRSVEEVTGGMTLESVVVQEDTIQEGNPNDGSAYRVQGTLMELGLPEAVEQGDTLELEIEWSVELPQSGAGRMGYSDREVYFVGYWFPKMATFDALRGWDAEPYLGNAEFHDGFGDYRASLSVPEGWTVMATGELENPTQVYTAVTRDRLAEAATSDERVTIAGQAERDAGTITTEGQDGWLTYEFAADSVRDFAWTTSNVQRWDATSAVVPDRDGDGEDDRVLIHSFWREDRAPLWSEQWRYGKQSIEFHSEYTGISYPWPHMTSVEGADIIGGGMEYPMMTVMGSYEGRGEQELFNVTSHELAHMWVPMIVSTNEKRHAWMDEGMTTFLESESRMEIWPGVDHHRLEARIYLQVARAGLEQSMMRHGDYYEPGPGYGIASYMKPATLMVALRQVLGEDVWTEAYRTFLSEWAYKHPTPWDFFNTFERVADRELDWFWTSFYYETWTLDHAVENVQTPNGEGPIVIVRDRGLAPFPAQVRVRTTEGETIEYEIPVEHWLRGEVRHHYQLPADAGRVTRVEIDPSGYAPDVDRSNNLWPRG